MIKIRKINYRKRIYGFWVKEDKPSSAHTISFWNLNEIPNGLVIDIFSIRFSIGSGTKWFW